DGIRDRNVTGVQTCALPILRAVRLGGAEPVALWHGEDDLQGVEAVVLPGGFSYGDYLRAGAISGFAPVMEKVVDAAKGGMPVLEIGRASCRESAEVWEGGGV